MSTDLIILIIFGGTTLLFLALIARALPRLRAVDVRVMRVSDASAVKERLIARRIRRKILAASAWVNTRTDPVQNAIRTRFRASITHLEHLEHRYRKKAVALEPIDKVTVTTKLATMLAEAAAAHKEGETAKAERRYIEAVSLAPNRPEAYQGLGEFYLGQKDYPHALESLRYALKLAPDNAELYLDLAAINQAMGAHKTALERCQQAVDLQPNDPKCLDALIAASILVKDRALAERTLERLESVNPENQKLADFHEQILELPQHEHAPVKKPVTHSIKKNDTPL